MFCTKRSSPFETQVTGKSIFRAMMVVSTVQECGQRITLLLIFFLVRHLSFFLFFPHPPSSVPYPPPSSCPGHCHHFAIYSSYYLLLLRLLAPHSHTRALSFTSIRCAFPPSSLFISYLPIHSLSSFFYTYSSSPSSSVTFRSARL